MAAAFLPLFTALPLLRRPRRRPQLSRPAAAPAVATRRTVWGFDSRYWRAEPLDDAGRSLGVVRFEPRREG